MVNEKILGPILVRPLFSYSVVCKERKDVEGKRARHMIELQWRQPYTHRDTTLPVIKVPGSCDNYTIPKTAILYLFKENRMFRTYPYAKLPRPSTRLVFKLYPVDKPRRKVEHVFIIWEFPLRCTQMGGYDDVAIEEVDGELFMATSKNVSRSGNHGKLLLIAVARRLTAVTLHVSNRGNAEEYRHIWDIDGYRRELVGRRTRK